MSAATESFLDQLEAAVSPAVIGTKKAAKALAPSDIKTSQQDKLADMGAYKRRQKKMEKGLLNQEEEKEALRDLLDIFMRGTQSVRERIDRYNERRWNR